MKRGRILSLFLSAVLLASAIIPCLQLSVNADKANAISEIKSAWNELKYYEVTEAFKGSRNTDNGTVWGILLEPTTTEAEKDVFGSYIFKINKNNIDNGSSWYLESIAKSNFLDFMPAEEIGDVYMNVSSNKEIKVKAGYHVYFSYVEGGITKSTGKVVFGPETTIPADGTPVKLSALNGTENFSAAMEQVIQQDATLSTKSDVKVQRFINFRLSVTQSDFRNTDTELTVGMGFFTHSSDPAFPADLGDSDDLVAIIDAAEEAIKDDSYTAESKTALQTAVNNAWNVVKTDRELVVKAFQSTWGSLIKNQETLFTMSAYNKTGLNPVRLNYNYNQAYSDSNYITTAPSGKEGDPLNDKAHSGVISTKVCTTEEDIANFGNSYTELRRKDPDVVGTAPDYNQDIPSMTKGDAIISANLLNSTLNYRSDIPSLAVNCYSTKAMEIGYKVWYYSNGVTSATATVKADIPANEVTTLDLKALINSDRGSPCHSLKCVVIFIDEIYGEVTDADVFKIGSVIGNTYDACPYSGDDVSLSTIFNKASSLDLSGYYNNAAKTRFQELLNVATAMFKEDLQKQFESKEELVKVVTTEIWPALVKKAPLDVKYFERYNSSGESGYTYAYVEDGKSDPADLADSRIGVSDAANSGYVVQSSSSVEQRNYFGSKYVRLTTQKFKSGNELNGDKSNDIPYLDTKHSVISTSGSSISLSGLKGLEVTVNSSMTMNLGYRIWVKVGKTNADGTTSERWATVTQEKTIEKDYTTIDLMAAIEKFQSQLDAAGNDEKITEFMYVAIGIKSMVETPDSNDYLEIGSIRGIFNATLPDGLNADSTAIKLYDEMRNLNLDDYYDGDAKENFKDAMAYAKIYSEQEWEEVYKDQDRLALLIKNELWSKLAGKFEFVKRFGFYNSTGLNASGTDYKYNLANENAPVGTDPMSSGTCNGYSGNYDIYGQRYFRLTNKKTDPSIATVNDRDIPYLDEKIAIISVGTREGTDTAIDVPGSHNIYMYMTSTMKMTINMGIWYMSAEDTNNDGKYNDWGLARLSFNIEEGLNKIDIKQLLIDNQVASLMKYLNYVTVNPCNFEHDVTDDDYLEVGSIGCEKYAVVPKKLSTITSLSAIVREAQQLNMDDYIDNADKTMFQNALASAVALLNSLDVNLTEHVPVEVYETDASGKCTKLSEDKFGYDEQAKLYDGVTDKDPVVLDAKNKKIDFIFNLNDKMSLHEISVYLAENNISDLAIYTAPVREAIWDGTGLVYRYDGSTPNVLKLGKTFTTPVENQYVRFSFNDIEGDTLKVTEFKCIGKGIQQLAYSNIIEGKTDVMSFANYNYVTGLSQFIRFESGKFSSSWEAFADQDTAHDGYLDTIVDFVGGSRSKDKNTTYNIIFDLNGLGAVDNIKYYAASSEEYFPRKMKFYLGDDQMNILDNNDEGTVCVAEFNYTADTVPEDGLYEAKFLARNAAYVRIELISDGVVCDDYCYGDSLLAVARDIQIRGLSLNSSNNDYVKSFTDEESGIIVDILKLSVGDIYETVQGIKLTKRKPTADEIAQGSDFGFMFRDWFYTVTFLNYRGEAVTDIGGREIRVSVPIADDEDMDLVFMATLLDGEVTLMEHNLLDIDDKYYISVHFDDPNAVVFAKGSIDDDYVPDEEEEEPQEEAPQEEAPQEEAPQEEAPQDVEPVTDDDDDFDDDEDYGDYDDEDYDDGDEDEEPEEEETSTGKKKYLKVIKKSKGGLSTGAIVGIVSGSVVVAAGGALLIIFRKKIFIPRKKTPKI